MAAASRALTLKLLADVSDFTKGLDKGAKQTDSMGDKLKKFGKAAAIGLAAAGAAAGAFAVKAIAAGEAAATSNARIDQINKSMNLFGDSTDQVTASLIKYAEETALATGIDQNSIKATQAKLLTFKDLAVTADQLNGNFQRATKAAIDLGAAGFGSAETNAVALGKALNDPIKGITALSRSGVTFTEVEKERIKTLVESNQVTAAQSLILAAIETQVGGTAEATANATDIMKVALSQVTETVGALLLPMVEKLSTFIVDTLVPNINTFIASLTGKGSVADATADGTLGAFEFGKMVEKVIKVVFNLRGVLIATAAVIAGVFVVSKVAAAVTATIVLIKSLIMAYNALKSSAIVAGIATAFALNPLLGVGAVAAAAAVLSGANALANKNNQGTENLGVPKNLVTEFGQFTAPEFKVDQFPDSTSMGTMPKRSASGSKSREILGAGSATELEKRLLAIKDQMRVLVFRLSTGGISPTGAKAELDALKLEMKVLQKQSKALEAQNPINITVNGAIDPEGTARTIIDVLNRSSARGTLGSAAFA